MTTFDDQYSAERRYVNTDIDLVSYLPDHLYNSEVYNFLKFFENFLKQLYYHNATDRGTNSLFEISAANTPKQYFELDTSGNGLPAYDQYGTQTRTFITSADAISIVEKVKRITNLHDPDLIDIEYIQRLADYMGYNVELSRAQVGAFATSSTDDENKYLRFIVSNLPNWYKIKQTKNAVKVLMYSFGLIADIYFRWTSDELAASINHPEQGGYGNTESLWLTEDISLSGTDAVSQIPKNYFTTPHFIVRINTDVSAPSWIDRMDEIVNAIETVRPICDVFEGLSAFLTATLPAVLIHLDTYSTIKMDFPYNTSAPLPSSFVEAIVETGGGDIYVETGSAGDIIVES